MSDDGLSTAACRTCGFIVAIENGKQVEPCACDVNAAHPNVKCKYRVAAASSVAIECDHGYDVCPLCDPCTCP
jgi:hypothetical protein